MQKIEEEKPLDNPDARLAYEVIQGRCSDNHWYKIRCLFKKHHLELTVSNIQFFAEIRRQIPRSAVGVDGVLECYSQAERILSKRTESIEGVEIINLLHQYGVRPHISTVTRWFKHLGGYRRNKQYSPQDLKPIFTAAFIYKAQHSTKLPEAN